MADQCFVRGGGGAILTFDVDKVPESVLQRVARGEERFVDKKGETVALPEGLRAVVSDGQPSLAVLQAQAAALGQPIPGVDIGVAGSTPPAGGTVVDLVAQMSLEQLKLAAAARKVATSGNKTELAERILANDAESVSGSDSGSDGLPESKT